MSAQIIRTALTAIVEAIVESKIYSGFDVSINEKANSDIKATVIVVIPKGTKQTASAYFVTNLTSSWDVKADDNKNFVNLYIGNTVQTRDQRLKIRFKQESVSASEGNKGSGGSGGGTTQTAIVESAQCLYCALAFNVLGKKIDEKELIPIDKFEEAQNSIEIGSNVTLAKMLGIANAWRKSSILGANKLYDTINGSSPPSKGEYRFYRGAGIDDTINEAYKLIKADKVVKESDSIKDKVPQMEDKWNPADIWIARKGFVANDIIQAASTNLVLNLNNFLIEKFSGEDLIGVSLKKITGSADLKPMNLTKDREISKVGYGGAKFNYKSLDTYIDFKSGSNTSIQFRNFSGSTGGWQGEVGIKGSSAKHGKIGAGAIWEVLKSHGIRPFNPNDNQQFYVNCGKDNLKKDIAKEIYELLKKFPAANYKVSTTNKDQEIAKIVYMEPEEKDKPAKPNHPQRWMYSKFLGLTSINAIKNATNSDEIVQDIYLYASSQHSLSGVYYKLT